MPIDPNLIQESLDALVTLAETWRDVTTGGPTETVQAGSQTLPTVAKLIADLSAQIVTGLESGYVLNVANDAGRVAAVPAAIGQLLFQRDTKKIYYSTSLTAGNFTLHPYDSAYAAAVQATSDVATMAIALAGKLDANAAGAATPLFYEYTTAGTFTLNVPTGSQLWAELTVIGAGGGGGGGRRISSGAFGSGVTGGGAGGAGEFKRVLRKIPSGVTSLTVLVGAAGAGGVGAIPSVNPTAGSTGGTSRVSGGVLYINALGGNPGAAGDSGIGAPAAAGGAARSNNIFDEQLIAGYAGGNGRDSSGLAGESITSPRYYPIPTGGGGGGGYNGSVQGGAGGGALLAAVGLASVDVRAAGGVAGGGAGENGGTIPGTPYGLGGGGGGGSTTSGLNGGAGGTGGPGAGGGGGGAARYASSSVSNPGNGGAGGAGGAGYVSVRFFRMPPV